MPPAPDPNLLDTPRILTLMRAMIVRLGVARSVLALTAATLLLSVILSTLLRLLFDAPVNATSLAIATIIPIAVAPPLSWLMAGLIVRLDQSERAQQYLATHDPLTELCNRREFFQRVARVHERAHRNGEPVWLLMIDLDRFKAINDELGHLAGDRAIRHVSDLCRAETRPTDVLGRYGGDEIAMLIVGADRDSAETLSTRLRSRITGTPLVFPDGRRLSLSASIGLTPVDPRNEPLDRAFARADEALRAAKRTGRDRICVSEPEGYSTLAA